MTEYETEHTPGLPGKLPAGERILWQGAPEWRSLARTAYHTRFVAGYFALLTCWAVASALTASTLDLTGVTMTLALGAIGIGLLHLLAWRSARTTIYTLTNRRIVMRIGIAVPKCINLPLGMIGAVDLAAHTDGSGDLPFALVGEPKLGYLALWPHAKGWKIVKPQPMLRSVPDAQSVAALIGRACLAAQPEGRTAPVETRAQPMPAFKNAAAA